jgi:hypothetical protein
MRHQPPQVVWPETVFGPVVRRPSVDPEMGEDSLMPEEKPKKKQYTGYVCGGCRWSIRLPVPASLD